MREGRRYQHQSSHSAFFHAYTFYIFLQIIRITMILNQSITAFDTAMAGDGVCKKAIHQYDSS
jgi:hypothetical protein